MLGLSRTPKRISPSAHEIPLSAVSNPALEVVDRLKNAGYEAYLVGGCVRDLLLRHHPKDFDVATSAFPEEVRQLFGNCRLIGRRFRLAHVRFGREIVEVATFRSGVVDGGANDGQTVTENGQIIRDNIYGDIEDDAFRRDFTINALYYDPDSEEVIDYVSGTDDIENRVLSTIGDPCVRFREDPVRMLRAVRFSVKLGFELNDSIHSAIIDSAPHLNHVPPSRLLDEVLKLFHNGYGESNFKALRDLGIFKYIFPFTEDCIDHGDDNIVALALRNTDRRVKEVKPVIPAFLFACLLWDPLKIDAQKLVEHGLRPRSAFSTAAFEVIKDQNQYVAIPRRIGVVVREIWSLQFRLEQRPKKNIISLLQHPRFRASYDFLLLRSQMGEVPLELANWWTDIQEVDEKHQQKMIEGLKPEPRRGRRRRRRRAA